MKFLRKYAVIGNEGGTGNRVFAYLSIEKDALEYSLKFPRYMHVEVFERITQDGKPIGRINHEQNKT